MQGSVHRYDERTGTGTVVTDDGDLVVLPDGVLAASGLRRLRVGQRLSWEYDGAGAVVAVAVPGLTPRRVPAAPPG